MDVLVCVKRVPTVGGAITVSADGLSVDTRMSGFTISPHEECAVEEAVRLVERFGGSVTVATLGPAEAEEQLRSCLALGASAAVLLETPAGAEFGPAATAAALHSVTAGGGFDLVLLGNEAADTGDYQVGIRLAHLLGWPVATGIKALTVDDEGTSAAARREYRGVAETYALPLPCVLTGYPSLPGRLRAKRAAISRVPVSSVAGAAPRTTALRVPAAARREATVLGHGVDAVPALVSVLAELGVLS
jgi:electron transfer flavoprotein beta subunit